MEALQEPEYQDTRTFSLGPTELWEAETLMCMVQGGGGGSTVSKHLVLYLCGFFVSKAHALAPVEEPEPSRLECSLCTSHSSMQP